MSAMQKFFNFTRWSILILFVGAVTGAVTVIFPPTASLGLVALAGVVLLWAIPEVTLVSEKLLRRMFFLMVFVLLCVPAYYAIETGFLPWISVRRLFIFAVIVLFSLAIAGTADARKGIRETLSVSRPLAFCALGFLLMIFVSIFTSKSPASSLNNFSNVLLNWYVPFFAAIFVLKEEKDILLVLKIIAVAAVIDSVAGVVEFLLQRRYYFDIFPKSMLDSMLASNPTINTLYYLKTFRNGLYRASSIYFVSLSFGEFAAMAAPIGGYFVLHGKGFLERSLGIIAIVLCIVALVISGSRGALLAFLMAMPTLALLWAFRIWKFKPHSLWGPIVLTSSFLGLFILSGLFAFSQRLRNLVTGGGEAAGSTDARFVQWELAKPHIIANPITGHGAGMAGDVVGYIGGNSLPTVDSYVISLLVETGVPGFVFFFGLIVCGVWVTGRLYLYRYDKLSDMAGPIACTLIAFGIYRLTLSQTENHTLFFLIIGIVFAVLRLSVRASDGRWFEPSRGEVRRGNRITSG